MTETEGRAQKDGTDSQGPEPPSSREDSPPSKELQDALADSNSPGPFPFTPGSSENPVQVALGMQLMMQRSSFDHLSEEIQKDIINLAATLDERGYDYACRSLEERSASRRWTVVPICGFAILLIGIGAFFANKLIEAGNFEQAMTLTMTGIGVIGALLGGVGLRNVFQSISGR